MHFECSPLILPPSPLPPLQTPPPLNINNNNFFLFSNQWTKAIRLFLTESINRIDKSTSQTNSLEINVFPPCSFFAKLKSYFSKHPQKKGEWEHKNEWETKLQVKVRKKYFIWSNSKESFSVSLFFFCFLLLNVHQSPHTHILCISHIMCNNKTRHLLTANNNQQKIIVILLWTCFEHEKSERKSTTSNNNKKTQNFLVIHFNYLE